MSAVASARRTRVRRRWTRISRRRMRVVLACVVIVALVATGAWFLVRNSSFVSVDHVTVTGVAGSDATAITAALDSAAHRMTTLDWQAARLRAAVSAFPDVKGLRISTRFPHGMVIHVIEVLPVAVVQAPGREVVVGGDGTLLPNVRVTGSLPLLPLAEPPIGGMLQERWARAAAGLLAAAPTALLARLAEVTTVAGHGLVVQVRDGPSIYLGDASQAAAKWAAVTAVLADPGSAGASYIDVTDPSRPVAGTDAQTASSAGTGTSAASTGTSSASTGTSSASTGTSAASSGTSSASTGAGTAGPTGSTSSTTDGSVTSGSTTPGGG